MTKNIIIGALVVIVILGGFFFFSLNGEKMAAETQTTAQTGSGVATTPCPDTASMRQELIAAEKAATAAAAEAQAKAKALKAAQKNCRPPLSGGDTLNVRLITDQPRAAAARTQPRSKRSSTTTTPATPNKSSGIYTPPLNQDNNNSISGGSQKKVTLCFNLKNGDGSSFWPHLAINAGQEVTGSVLNGDGTGYNVVSYPVAEISGLWGITSDNLAFIKAEIIQDFQPTTILIAGDPSSWQWIRADLVGDYYVAQF